MSSENDQDKKTVIVTGAGTGIGASVAKLFAGQGWKVILNGRTESSLQETQSDIIARGGEALICVGDVSQSDDVRKLISMAGDTLDALVHSAGIGHCLTIDELDEDEWKATMDVAVTGAFLTAKHALPVMRTAKAGVGHIIQICSLASGGTWELEVGYGTAKGAQLKFALHLDSQLKKEAEEGGRKIHVHAVCPGTVDTPFWDRIPQRDADPDLTLSADEVAWLVGKIIENPEHNAESLAEIKPRAEIIIERHRPFEAWSNVIALKHNSHP